MLPNVWSARARKARFDRRSADCCEPTAFNSSRTAGIFLFVRGQTKTIFGLLGAADSAEEDGVSAGDSLVLCCCEW